MKVRVDRSRCQVLAQCVFAAPDVFELDEDDRLVYDAEPDDALWPDVELAARSCPVKAILLDDN
ncbi:ferredoxin [Glycomyces sp. TRM65418]|uniref:ferredoxin n=1 Tax=Glycomyces sp. TRM65418 TaxID=2867006 RepID=UPI001CE6AC5D|nr:ferredoxin [Glycomyces sp. TRM65418]MCC3765339.1 ferredoxin [Glycomyces sp. TRM65418]QZD54956.1 ferredoxin [Glycomyces sp. TRM65418]